MKEALGRRVWSSPMVLLDLWKIIFGCSQRFYLLPKKILNIFEEKFAEQHFSWKVKEADWSFSLFKK